MKSWFTGLVQYISAKKIASCDNWENEARVMKDNGVKIFAIGFGVYLVKSIASPVADLDQGG